MATYYEPPYAQVHFRLAAWLLDVLILTALSMIPLLIIYSEGGATACIAGGMALESLYFLIPMTFFHTTPGKRILNMRIVMQDGAALETDAAILRYLVFFLTALIPFGLLASGVLLFVDPERRAFHDRIAKTVVVSGYNRF